MKLTTDELRKIASDLHSEGFWYAEAVPTKLWVLRGWPEDLTVFKIVDSQLKLFRLIESYHEKADRS